MPNWTSGSTRSRVTEPGARIAPMLLNDFDTVTLYFAIARSGRVNVPINKIHRAALRTRRELPS
jgi:acyl-CoA synthetase (AMP-forming)/AMP-acid ligase II